ncbi:toll-like receptor 2 isoform X1 [Sus scrofa]|uniref:Toll-like receptor 2 n=2 Tax=Sus scrofa TaxID=9823 RepID=A0A8D1VGR5_PIG|nr:toll-like receptor 2 isoform X1 [Sus scrofa]XP_005653634.1 toll-like receptor 2 isoform X1 [Sus scrofa]XP_005653635.1 toll-like receptor 2 isoform X1 [Sus scrofa]XP_005653636.1 toll-like receptor 2 isoform X1 [Sus scrofa]AHA36586.1 toll-like receptor 2 [Sus scrofa]BAD91799.1 Toll-like receptor 2 [Sus scrofa]
MPCALWTAWVLGIVISLSKEGAPHQASSLSCDPAGVCDGRSRSLSSIPSGLTAAVKSLDLSNNRIAYVGSSDLRKCVNLRALRLGANSIHTVEEDSFSSLGSLEHLDLSYNHLSNLSSSWFKSLSTLKFLNLLGNPYKTLGETPLFSHLPNLRILKIGNNDTFAEIQAKDFQGLTFLQELEIGASHLQRYAPKSLRSIQNISHLILHMRRPALLPKIFVDLLSSLEYLELRNTDFSTFNFSDVSINEPSTVMKKFTFRKAEITDASFTEIVKLLNYVSGALEVEFDDCTLNGRGDFSTSALDTIKSLGNVETLTVRRLHIPQFFLFYDLRSIYSLTGAVKRITIENSKVFLVPCSLSQHLKSLEYLDLSENLMSEEYLKNSACEHAWPFLHTLILRQNHLKSLEKTGEVLVTLKNLTNLDISKNNFDSMPETCQWPEKMKYLNLSSTRIHSLTHCLPQTLEVLDISNNNLNSFSLSLPQLKELYISRNKLKTLPDASFLPMLSVLRISRNTINTFSKEQLDSFQKLKTLEAGGNNFICSCDFLSFTQGQQALAQVLSDWPENYLCDSPSHVRGQRVQDTRLSLTECHRVAVVSVVCCALFLLLLLTGALCHHFHGLWYMKMMWAWLQAKRKPRKAPRRDVCYDAFVSYSEQDSYWVENLMVQELEHFQPPFKLCLHKRDFIPGKWIIDNIIDSIEKSQKTIFVLSENFVKSEWCKYELDFSHFRLFDENDDTAILILLEPIEKKAIPQRFCKLRKIMNTRTYLEWPADETQREGFWLNLRAAIKS